MTFTMSFEEWAAQVAGGMDKVAAREKWRQEGLALYARVKNRPSKAEEELANASFEMPDERRPRRYGPRA